MIRKTIIYFFIILLGIFVCPQEGKALGEAEIVIEKNFTFTPTFMSGHEGDLSWISGYNFIGDVLMDGNKVGTFSASATVLNPPLVLTDVFSYAIVSMTSSIPGLGTFEQHGQSISFGSSTTLAAGDSTVSLAGSISNGSGDLSNTYGIFSGIGTINFYTGQGSLKDTILYRTGVLVEGSCRVTSPYYIAGGLIARLIFLL